jgi:hypothetical protein
VLQCLVVVFAHVGADELQDMDLDPGIQNALVVFRQLHNHGDLLLVSIDQSGVVSEECVGHEV